MINSLSLGQIQEMRKSGLIAAQALRKVLKSAEAGVSLVKLDRVAEEEINRLGGESSFKTVKGYYWTTCLTVNEEVVHGVPRRIKLKRGDLLSVDLGVVYRGWYTDVAWTIVVDGRKEEVRELKKKKRFLATGERALWAAVESAVVGKKIGDISWAIQQHIERGGYGVVKSLVGHGVGRSYHEPPEIPGFGRPGTGLELKERMCLALEVIYVAGNGQVYVKDDGWTIASSDGSWGGLFEMTVVVRKDKPEVLTDWRKV